MDEISYDFQFSAIFWTDFWFLIEPYFPPRSALTREYAERTSESKTSFSAFNRFLLSGRDSVTSSCAREHILCVNNKKDISLTELNFNHGYSLLLVSVLLAAFTDNQELFFRLDCF